MIIKHPRYGIWINCEDDKEYVPRKGVYGQLGCGGNRIRDNPNPKVRELYSIMLDIVSEDSSLLGCISEGPESREEETINNFFLSGASGRLAKRIFNGSIKPKLMDSLISINSKILRKYLPRVLSDIILDYKRKNVL